MRYLTKHSQGGGFLESEKIERVEKVGRTREACVKKPGGCGNDVTAAKAAVNPT